MYDIINRESFDDIEMWVNAIKKEITNYSNPKFAMILIDMHLMLGCKDSN